VHIVNCHRYCGTVGRTIRTYGTYGTYWYGASL